MKVQQTKFGNPEGNCFEACIATITGIPLEEIPRYLSPDWFAEYRAWLSNKDWHIAWWDVRAGSVPPGLAIASGPSVRGLSHSVVYLNGMFYHDPHPSGLGIGEIQYWMLLWKESI